MLAVDRQNSSILHSSIKANLYSLQLALVEESIAYIAYLEKILSASSSEVRESTAVRC